MQVFDRHQSFKELFNKLNGMNANEEIKISLHASLKV